MPPCSTLRRPRASREKATSWLCYANYGAISALLGELVAERLLEVAGVGEDDGQRPAHLTDKGTPAAEGFIYSLYYPSWAALGAAARSSSHMAASLATCTGRSFTVRPSRSR